MSREDSRRLSTMSAELVDMADRVPEEIRGEWEAVALI